VKTKKLLSGIISVLTRVGHSYKNLEKNRKFFFKKKKKLYLGNIPSRAEPGHTKKEKKKNFTMVSFLPEPSWCIPKKFFLKNRNKI